TAPATPPVAEKNATVVDPDRRAAEWVLSIGGSISIKENGSERQIGAVGDVPRGGLELAGEPLNSHANLSDVGRQIAVVGDLPRGACGLTGVGAVADNPKVSDAGLAHFKDCKNLRFLSLVGGFTKFTDVGLAHFKDCKDLRFIRLNYTPV